MPIDELLAELDASWHLPTGDARFPLRIFGSMALMLQTPYRRGTSDGDVLESAGLSATAKRALQELAGRGTPMARRHGMYIEVVAAGLPFLPQVPRWNAVSGLPALRHFDVTVLDVVDVVVSKLKRFEAKDRDDILAMIDLDRVAHDALIERFRLAVDWWTMDARAEELPAYVEHLHEVERDVFRCEPTEIELPSWI